MIVNYVLAGSGLILLLLCLGVFLSNPNKAVNRALSAFLASGFVWLIANLLTNISTTETTSLYFARSALVGAALIPLFFLTFAVAYTHHRKLTKGYLALISFLPLLIILSTPTSWNIVSIEAHGKNAEAGTAYVLLIIVLLSYFIYGIWLLVNYYKSAPAVEKAQLQYIFAGLALTLVPGVVANGFLPLFGSSQASVYGPTVVLGMSVFTTIAIVRHRLLDIRLLVARSAAYLLLLVTLSLLYALSIFGLSTLFFENDRLPYTAHLTFIALALVLGFSLQPLKRFFDKWTNRLFYRDAYDPQVFLDQLNSKLVTTIDLDEILESSAQIISQHLKSDTVAFVIHPTDAASLRIVGTHKLSLSQEELSLIHSSAHTTKTKVTLTSDLNVANNKLNDVLNKHAIMAIASLVTRKEKIGYLLVGVKKSGNVYNKVDARTIEIISKELAIAIQNALRFEEISRFNITLQKKIEEATHEIRKANIRLKELDKTKDEFISMASHQLRTPLTAVKGYLSMVLEGDTGVIKKEQKDLLQRSFDGADRMVYLIADLLNVSRLQSGKFVIENKPTDLIKLVSAEVEQLQESASNHQLKLSFHKPENFPETVMIDETKIRQVVMNFLDNAIYYTPAGGSVDVALSSTDKEISYTVTDTGLGVPKEEQHHLFSKFYRAGNARKMRPDGTGLGLFMARKVIVAQGGAIIFKSTEGKGSVFGFSFPMDKVKTKT